MALVLVVDDEPDLRELVRLNLELEGHDVLVAIDGDDALATMAAADPLPDLAVLDVMMPGLDGWGVLAKWKADKTPGVSSVPVLLLTARTDDMDRIRGGIEGAVRYLTKPFSVMVLRTAIADALAGAPEAEQRRDAQNQALRQLARLESGSTAPSDTPTVHLARLERSDPERRQAAPAPALEPLDREVLSDKQRQLLDVVASTETVSAAADQLGVSRSNIYASLRRVGRRLGVESVPDLIQRARAGSL